MIFTNARRMRKSGSPLPPHLAHFAAADEAKRQALVERKAAQAERKETEKLQDDVLTPFSPVHRTTRRKGRNRRRS